MALDSYPASVTLRDGSTVVLTPLQPSCSGALLAFYRHLPEEDRLMLRDDVTTSDWAEGFLRKVETREIISLVAKAAGKVVGEATLYRTLHGWTRHVGEIRVTVAAAFRRKGLATWVLKKSSSRWWTTSWRPAAPSRSWASTRRPSCPTTSWTWPA
jgi:GNAT superfamily N-acetyltransferase